MQVVKYSYRGAITNKERSGTNKNGTQETAMQVGGGREKAGARAESISSKVIMTSVSTYPRKSLETLEYRVSSVA